MRDGENMDERDDINQYRKKRKRKKSVVRLIVFILVAAAIIIVIINCERINYDFLYKGRNSI